MLRLRPTPIMARLLGTMFALQHAEGQTTATIKISTVACRATPDIAEMERVSGTKDKGVWEKFIMPRLADKRCVVMNGGTTVSIDQRLVRPNGTPITCIRRVTDAECWWIASDLR